MSILQKVKRISVSSENLNTNNAWGFGGSIGTLYTLPDGAKIKIGRYCYRHASPTPYMILYEVDENQNTSKTYIERYLNKFRETCALKKIVEPRTPKPIVNPKRSYVRRHNTTCDQLKLEFA